MSAPSLAKSANQNHFDDARRTTSTFRVPCQAHDSFDPACTSCAASHARSIAENASRQSLPWNADPARPRSFADNARKQLIDASHSGNPAGRDSSILLTQGLSEGAPADQQQADSLLFTSPSSRQFTPAQSATEIRAPAVSQPVNGTPRNQIDLQHPTLVVRTAGATRPVGTLQTGQPIPGEGDDKLEIYVNNRDVREVLTLLSEQGGINILPLEGATGPCSFAMNGVTVDEALDGILRSTGLIAHREGPFVLVGTPADFETKRQPYDFIAMRVYRPDYITSTELKTLLQPLLSQGIGKMEATSPSSVGIPSDAEDAGGNSNADTDALLVQDYESVLKRFDQIVLEVDRRPLQVAIEAMILSVALQDEMDLGVDFEFLRNQGTIRFGLGSPEANLTGVSFEDGGLRFAFLDSNLGTFINALEQIGDTDVIATPRLTVLNKQRAEILIGAQLGYVNTTVTETAATQSVDFLEIGTQLRLRPFIARDGSIRLEVHPELSTGNVRIEGGFTLPDKEVTSVTTNIMVQDGCTLVIGGLMREDLVTNHRQIPYLGSLPWLGRLFRSKSESTEKREIVLLVTPRIVREPDVCSEGEAVACEFHRRQAAVAERMSPLSRTATARRHFRNAQHAWSRGDWATAMDQVHWSLQFDPQNRAALDLQADILSRRAYGAHTLPPDNPHGQLPSATPPHAHQNQRSEYLPPPQPSREFVPPGSISPQSDQYRGQFFPATPAPTGEDNSAPAGLSSRSALAPAY
ncbi:MAG: hypothetical protein MPJ50_15290 [Pirellulales bacterium]|nr:hypothetical protein [Pirellulales bacterium]